MASITITLSDEVYSKLQRRAKKNLLGIREQIEDIVRRSMLSYGEKTIYGGDTDDRLVNIFSKKWKGKKK